MGPMADDADVLASDADRERVAAALRRHYVEGRLTMTELEERLEEAYAARTLDALKLPIRQLPQLAEPRWPAKPLPDLPGNDRRKRR